MDLDIFKVLILVLSQKIIV